MHRGDRHGRPATICGLHGMQHREGIGLVRQLVVDTAANAGEHRLNWARLPLGPMLARIVLRDDEGIRGSGDDLTSYFYQLGQIESMLPRNAFGRRVREDIVKKHGGEPGVAYRCALRGIPMGDHNARMDIASGKHRGPPSCLQLCEARVLGGSSVRSLEFLFVRRRLPSSSANTPTTRPACRARSSPASSSKTVVQ